MLQNVTKMTCPPLHLDLLLCLMVPAASSLWRVFVLVSPVSLLIVFSAYLSFSFILSLFLLLFLRGDFGSCQTEFCIVPRQSRTHCWNSKRRTTQCLSSSSTTFWFRLCGWSRALGKFATRESKVREDRGALDGWRC